jgi:6-pyruvoyltetrahydropterin/6-carboxytetrahydropterin synthase
MQVTLEGETDRESCYLRNIKEIDQVVRERCLGLNFNLHEVFDCLRDAWPGATLHSVTVCLTPFLCATQLASEFGMYTRLSQKFEFSASHRLHNPELPEDVNRKVFGKCNNPNGHGHNYEVQVTLRGKPNESGLIVDVPAFERVVQEHAVERLDHKNLNLDVPEFAELIPTVENIAMVIYRMLKDRFTSIGADLASVTVWETPKTWCEYSE